MESKLKLERAQTDRRYQMYYLPCFEVDNYNVIHFCDMFNHFNVIICGGGHQTSMWHIQNRYILLRPNLHNDSLYIGNACIVGNNEQLLIVRFSSVLWFEHHKILVGLGFPARLEAPPPVISHFHCTVLTPSYLRSPSADGSRQYITP